MNRIRFIYDFEQDKAFLESDQGKKEITCFKLKAQLDVSETEVSYWPLTKAKRKLAREIHQKQGIKPSLYHISK